MRPRHRQPAQTFIMAAIAMTSMIGALSMVVDAGVYFVLQRQMQNAADAGALAAVWYGACTTVDPTFAFGCQPTAPHAPPPNCTDPLDYPSCTAATDEVHANSGVALSLCAGPNLAAGIIPITINSHPGPVLNIPHVSTYVVSLSCDAPHWFGRIFPNLNLTMHIDSSAAAASGWRGANGQILGGAYPPGTPPGKFVARLVV